MTQVRGGRRWVVGSWAQVPLAGTTIRSDSFGVGAAWGLCGSNCCCLQPEKTLEQGAASSVLPKFATAVAPHDVGEQASQMCMAQWLRRTILCSHCDASDLSVDTQPHFCFFVPPPQDCKLPAARCRVKRSAVLAVMEPKKSDTVPQPKRPTMEQFGPANVGEHCLSCVSLCARRRALLCLGRAKDRTPAARAAFFFSFSPQQVTGRTSVGVEALSSSPVWQCCPGIESNKCTEPF